MCKTLLIANKFYIVLSSIVCQFFYFGSSKPIGRCYVGVRIQLKYMFCIQVKKVHLIGSHSADFPLQKFHIWNRTTAYIIHPTSIFQCRIVGYCHTIQIYIVGISIYQSSYQQLFECLQTIEQTLLCLGFYLNHIGTNIQHISLFGIGFKCQSAIYNQLYIILFLQFLFSNHTLHLPIRKVVAFVCKSFFHHVCTTTFVVGKIE